MTTKGSITWNITIANYFWGKAILGSIRGYPELAIHRGPHVGDLVMAKNGETETAHETLDSAMEWCERFI